MNRRHLTRGVFAAALAVRRHRLCSGPSRRRRECGRRREQRALRR